MEKLPDTGKIYTELFALVDCNNFYASCERVFNPALRNQPVIVLSNNDGCVIARSAEAKAIGIKMGVPAFQIEKLINTHQVAVFSSNYALYGDFSARVMHTLAHITPDLEIYSIDEAFLNLSGLASGNYEEIARKIRRVLLKNTGIPVSVGVAPTKTLAKIANHLAKKNNTSICILDDDSKISQALHQTPVGEIWGIGKQYGELLRKNGISTAAEFAGTSEPWIRKYMNVNGVRTRKELCAIPCISLEEVVPAKKAICTSRSFGQMQTSIDQLGEAVSTFATRCAEKLRTQRSAATQVMVFIHTNAFRTDQLQYARNRVVTLPAPSNNTLELVKASVDALQAIFRDGYLYKKAGVIVTGLVPESEIQQNLFAVPADDKKRKLMESIDSLSSRYGHDTVKTAVQGTGRKWKLRQERLSPAYTTRWSELMEIRLEG